jgi:predicted small lipoprotein YifL
MRKLPLVALAILLPLAACGRSEPAPAPADGNTASAPPANTALGRKIQEAMAEASRKLAEENIRVGEESGKPKAQISPKGDFLVDGKAVPVDDTQRRLLLAHRANLIAVAQAGIAVGMQGADLGLEAATGALKSVFTGTSDDFEQRMEARGKQIEAEAVKICQALPPLLASQQALAAALPAFQPYATMDQSDIDDCGKDGHYDVDVGGTHASAEVERDADDGHNTDAAAEADAAAARPDN